MASALVSLILLAPALAAPQRGSGRPQDDGAVWQSLALPSLARRPPPPVRLQRLETGRALLAPREEPEVRETPAPAALEPAGLLGLLLDEIGARGLDVELHPSAPPLLARGSPADVALLRAIAADLDDLGRRLDVRLAVWIAPPTAADAELGPAAFAAVVAREPDYEAVLRSGESTSFGARSTASFLTDYQIEVAHKTGVAAPVLSRALLGTVLHVRASRRSRGKTVQLECLAEATALDGEPALFDPGTPDLGYVEQPSVRVAQVLFSDVVESGGATALAIRGSDDGWADRTLWIRAETEPDPPEDEPEDELGARSWRGLDLAAFEEPTFDLPLPSPGSGLADRYGPSAPLGVLGEAFPAALVALAAEGGTRSRPGPVWTPGYVLVPTGSAAWLRARALVDALESTRGARARLRVIHGALHVDLPLAADLPARVLIGRETRRLVGYRTEVAEQSWMPAPTVEPLFDGFCIQGELEGRAQEGVLRGQAWIARTESEREQEGVLRGQAWIARTESEGELERADASLARLQLLTRTFESRSVELGGPLGESSARAFALSASAPGLALELSPH